MLYRRPWSLELMLIEGRKIPSKEKKISGLFDYQFSEIVEMSSIAMVDLRSVSVQSVSVQSITL
jgi:hypothetical protein